MRKRIESAFWFAIENGPAILTIGFSAYVIGLAQTSTISTDVILQWILAILGLLAISELIERLRKLRRLEEMSNKTLRAVQSKLGERPSADDFFMTRMIPVGSYIEKASDIRLFGVSLQRTIRENIDVLAKQLKEGATIKAIIVDPFSQTTEDLVRLGSNLTLEYLQANSKITMQILKWLSKLPEGKGTIELRFMDEEPYFNVLAFDPEKEYGTIFVEFYPQRWERGNRPRVELTPGRDEYWFTYFKNQFDRLWQDCKPVSLDSEEEPPNNKSLNPTA